jgi:hypothetical protein
MRSVAAEVSDVEIESSRIIGGGPVSGRSSDNRRRSWFLKRGRWEVMWNVKRSRVITWWREG